jgi:hypothetical protein
MMDLNVNNFGEASFKVFDKVFLESTSNKRLDTLATIILEDFLPYYEIIIETLKPKQVHYKLRMKMNNSYLLYQQSKVTFLSDDMYEVRGDSDIYNVKYSKTVRNCTCREWDSTGLLCKH